ncbi:MAG: TetR/AcrR family transcriptional regulator [Deltaproteobacteria bacterium]|jgi:AcrR family transcriptional regulator|nr:TetR/AcrR family transcriptional regulator [Deltaproteobacteria bacterium]
MATSKKFPTYQFNILGETINLPLVEDIGKTKEIILVNSTILFSKKGYDAVSIRDIAKVIGIKPSSLYNHYSSKEALFEAVLRHAEDLYLLYFRRLDENLAKCRSLEEMLDLMFSEPKKMGNIFTCYAFSLIQTEQFRDERSGMIMTNTFLEYSINFIKNWLDKAVEKGYADPFDTKTVAVLIMEHVLMSINLRVHECLDRHIPFSYAETFDGLKLIILKLAGR